MTHTYGRIPVALAAVLLTLPALAPSRAEAASYDLDPTQIAAGKLAFAPFVALDIPTASGVSIGPRIGGELMYGVGEVAQKMHLDIGPRASFTYNGGDASLWTLDVLGTARLSYLVNKGLSVYGEAGLGLGYYHVSVDFLGGSVSDSGIMFDILFAPGIIYAITPTMNLLGEVGIWINAKDGVGTHIAIPTIGVQWKILS